MAVTATLSTFEIMNRLGLAMLILSLFILSHPSLLPLQALKVIPLTGTLSHIVEIRSGSNNDTNDAGTRDIPIVIMTAVSIGPGLPPIPLKNVNKIEAGDFIYMDKLTRVPHRLRTRGPI